MQPQRCRGRDPEVACIHCRGVANAQQLLGLSAHRAFNAAVPARGDVLSADPSRSRPASKGRDLTVVTVLGPASKHRCGSTTYDHAGVDEKGFRLGGRGVLKPETTSPGLAASMPIRPESLSWTQGYITGIRRDVDAAL